MRAWPVASDPLADTADRMSVVEAPAGELRRTLHERFTEVQRLLQAGQSAEALLPLREILQLSADNPDALNLAGVAFGQMGMHGDAERYSRQAVAQKPDDAGFQLNLANRLNDQGRLDEAVAVYKRAIELMPDQVAALKSYMRCLVKKRDFSEAKAVAESLENHIQSEPSVLVECAEVCLHADDRRHALELYQRAVELEPDHVEWMLQVARLAIHFQQVPLAMAIGERVLALTEHAEIRAMLASIMHRLGKFDAMAEHLDAIGDNRDQGANAANLKGMMLAWQAKVQEGLEAMARTKTLAPDAFDLQATRVMYLNYSPDLSPQAIAVAHREFGETFGRTLPLLDQADVGTPHDPDRKLRIGYVSPDFRAHSVAYFARPFFDTFDRGQFDVIGYANLPKEDAVSASFREKATDWRNVFGLSAQKLAEQIRRDRIDILIDLAGLTRDSSLRAFTARPAPIQMTYIGYPNTTGLPQIDYRITDWVADPEGCDSDYTETLIRLPNCFLCYAIPCNAPPVEPGPCEHRDHVTFGSFNNFAKINPAVLQLWAEVLLAVPGSRLLLKSVSSADQTAQSVIREGLERHGVDPGRVHFAEFREKAASHLALYHDVDIALDPFPYNGTTTTCEALWMGVPVITLSGDRHAGRVGASLLTAVGLEACIAHGHEEYVTTAKLMAENRSILKSTRRTLRGAMSRSPLCDNKAHARILEQAFRATWQIWCEQNAGMISGGLDDDTTRDG